MLGTTMKIRRKPDFLFLLAIIVGLGVILTMRAQAGSDTHSQSSTGSTYAAAQTAFKKTN